MNDRRPRRDDPDRRTDELKRQGVAAVFTPGAHTAEIVDFLRGRCLRERARGGRRGPVGEPGFHATELKAEEVPA